MVEDETQGVQDDYSSEPANSSKPYLDAIEESEKAFRDYQEKADNIDKLYADLSKLAATVRDRQFQMFWANIEVLKPSIYSRPPVPVVMPRFRDRRPVPRKASEVLERSTIVCFEQNDIDHVMRLVRDDMVIQARGQAWLRYDTKYGEKVCIEHTDRRDFLHGLARNWQEVPWVAKRAWLTKDEMEDRFKETSGDAYLDAEYQVQKDDKTRGAATSENKAGVWEIWHKDEGKVIWVTPGVDKVLDEDKPHLTLEGFYPCPRPAYATVQRRSLIPVPDVLFYKDQLEELNEITARLSALTEALKVRGFYPAGAGEIGDAVEAAIKKVENNQVLIPISNWAAFGGGAFKDMIVWLPLDMIAETVTQLIALRKELIQDVYEITGLSDIMRGSTEASETATAQQLKSQYGSIRIRDRQAEIVRFSRDITRIAAEIMAENFTPKTLLEMSQVDDLKTEADLAQQVTQIIEEAKAQAAQALQNPELRAQAEQNPQAAEQALAQLSQATDAKVQKAKEQPTVEKVMSLLREQRLRPFVLDIETDSTISPDEDAQKQRATEFMTALGGFMNQALPLIQTVPQAAPLMSDALKFVSSQFRAGRELEGSIDEFAEQMKELAKAPKPPNPEQVKAQSEAQSAQAAAMKTQADAQKQMVDAQSQAQNDELDRRIREQEALDASQARQADLDAKRATAGLEMQQKAQKHAQEMDIGALQIQKLQLEIEGVKVKTNATVAATHAKIEQTNTQTDNSIASTNAGIAATERGVEIKAQQAERADA
jgi:hypothetical protein